MTKKKAHCILYSDGKFGIAHSDMRRSVWNTELTGTWQSEYQSLVLSHGFIKANAGLQLSLLIYRIIKVLSFDWYVHIIFYLFIFFLVNLLWNLTDAGISRIHHRRLAKAARPSTMKHFLTFSQTTLRFLAFLLPPPPSLQKTNPSENPSQITLWIKSCQADFQSGKERALVWNVFWRHDFLFFSFFLFLNNTLKNVSGNYRNKWGVERF